MTWTEAIEGTLRQWTAIRDSIGQADEVELLTEINAVVDLCEKAEAEEGSPFGRCRRCLFYQQFGGCQDICGRMSEAVVEKDWNRLRYLIDETINGLKSLNLPLAATA